MVFDDVQLTDEENAGLWSDVRDLWQHIEFCQSELDEAESILSDALSLLQDDNDWLIMIEDIDS